MALFAGTSGSRVHVPDLANRLKIEPRSALVLEALKRGSVAPFGSYTAEERLAASFLDCFCQIVRNAGDPGLLRMLLHQGSARQKLWAFLIANGMSELRRHRFTSRFVDAAHEALHGKSPGFLQKYGFAKEYRPLVKELELIAWTHNDNPAAMDEQLRASVPAIFHELTNILADRIKVKVERYERKHRGEPPVGLQELIDRLELPADLRTLLGGAENGAVQRGMTNVDLRSIVEGLPFPALAAAVIGGSTYASTKVLFANRPLLDEFSQAIRRYRHPRRALWLTDTFADKNGVATAMRLLHAEAVRRDLPVDFVVCHASTMADRHLRVLKPMLELPLPFYEHQPIRAFDIMELQRMFLSGGYDRVVCSTEGLMGLAALYLKNAFSVPAFFYVHTDWIDFARRTLKLGVHNTDRVRRMLRAFYHGFDGLFVLNSEQLDWFASDAMGIERARLRQTAHWPDPRFAPRDGARSDALPRAGDADRVLLFVGRVSDEKGVMELPSLLEDVRVHVPSTRLVVVGGGPAEQRLRSMVPDGVFIPWVETPKLADIYRAADLLVLPSRFDTFGCVVVEALASGLPVVAYRTKGPRDIVQDGVCGFTVESRQQLAAASARILEDRDLQTKMRQAAVERAKAYRPDGIVDDLLRHLGLVTEATVAAPDDGPLPHQRAQDHDLGAWGCEA
jgi:glycosyltransferase involved in cell wall biosynthesis